MNLRYWALGFELINTNIVGINQGDIELFQFITVFCGIDVIPLIILGYSNIHFECEEICDFQSHKTLLWIWMILWTSKALNNVTRIN